MKIFKNKDVIEQKIDDEIILYVPINDSVVSIDTVGTKLWELIDDGIEFDDLINRFYECFEEKPLYEQFLNEVDETLSSYVKAGLLIYAEQK